jgi:hypothetical protein
MGTARAAVEGSSAHNALRVFRYFRDLVGQSTDGPFQARHVGYETISLRLYEVLDTLSAVYAST